MPAPDLAAVKTYLGSEQSWSDPEITGALAAETAAQANACRMPCTRSLIIATTAASTTVTGTFTTGDVNSEVTADGVPAGVTILSVAADLTSAVLSAAATASGAVFATLAEPWPADLAEALLRRVSHNLAMKALPLAIQTNLDGIGVRIGPTDPEVRRLEMPHRRLVVG